MGTRNILARCDWRRFFPPRHGTQSRWMRLSCFDFCLGFLHKMYTLFELHHVSNSCFRTKKFRRWAAQLCWWIFYKAVIDRTRCWLYQRDPASRNTLSLQGIWNERLFIIALLDFLNAQSASISRKLTSSSCPWKRWRKILECQARISYQVLLLASFQDVWDLIVFFWLPSFVHDWVLCSCCESGIIFVMMMSKVFYDELQQKQKKRSRPSILAREFYISSYSFRNFSTYICIESYGFKIALLKIKTYSEIYQAYNITIIDLHNRRVW